jgi:hypothetical protein
MVEGFNRPRRTAYLESGPDGHVNLFVDVEIIIIGNSYLATSRLQIAPYPSGRGGHKNIFHFSLANTSSSQLTPL